MDEHSSQGRLVRAAPLLPLVIGALGLLGEREGVLTAPAAIAATAIAAAVAVWAIASRAARGRAAAEAERRRLAERLEEYESRDSLTGLPDRRRIEEELRRRLAFASRYGTQVAALAIDLDDFDAIAERHGRATGDELLIASAEVLGAELRATDVIGRLGPHGFAVLVPQTDEHAARIVAGKLIRRLRAIERGRPDGASIALRASIGVALSHAGGLDDPAGLLRRAEEALAAARAAGGDRLALPGPPSPASAEGARPRAEER